MAHNSYRVLKNLLVLKPAPRLTINKNRPRIRVRQWQEQCRLLSSSKSKNTRMTRFWIFMSTIQSYEDCAVSVHNSEIVRSFVYCRLIDLTSMFVADVLGNVDGFCRTPEWPQWAPDHLLFVVIVKRRICFWCHPHLVSYQRGMERKVSTWRPQGHSIVLLHRKCIATLLRPAVFNEIR